MRNRFWLALIVCALASTWTFRSALADDATSGVGNLGMNQMIIQSSQLQSLNVYNREDTNHKLGRLDNLLIDARTGQVMYGILDTGILGTSIGGKVIPVPWQAFQVKKAANKSNDYWLTLNKTDRDLASAPTFDKSHWPDFANSKWKQSVDNFFGVRTVARPSGEQK